MHKQTIGCALGSALLCAVTALAQEPLSAGDKPVKVAAGQEAQIGVFTNINQACSGLPAPELRIAAPPARGMLIVRLVVLSVPTTAKACAEKKLPALALFYRANTGVDGADQARVEVAAGTAVQTQSYAITVTK